MFIWFVDVSYIFFLFKNISPYFWASLGIATCVGLSIVGAAWCVGGLGWGMGVMPWPEPRPARGGVSAVLQCWRGEGHPGMASLGR